MQALLSLFPKHDFTLLAFIVLLPLIGAFVNGVFGKRLGKEAVTLMGLSVIAASFVLSLISFGALAEVSHGGGAEHLAWKGWEWMRLSLAGDMGTFGLSVGLSLDQLNGTMALVVTGVGFLIHLYSSKYMLEDPGYYRFFAYLNLFIFSMLVLILGDSLPVLFVGWEGVGLCSYLLIGFWFEDINNSAAGKKAFIANRVGDFGLLVAMGLLAYFVGALDWQGIEVGRERLLNVAVQYFPALPWTGIDFFQTPFYASPATLVSLALFLGCAGKSAQIPLYVWLPDAMAGPTPVSALIHAATMVTAGVYLMCRLSFVFVLSPAAMFTIALIGALTALFAATIAFAQNDIKKVLAYSTVSQLGYMFLGVGVGAFTAGFFHVVTHAFFKACLFLGAGSVIHAMHARIHDVDSSQDMRNMGGLKKYLPITFWTFAASWAAIVGFPLTSGFFSKDAILIEAFSSSVTLDKTQIRIPSSAGGSTELVMWPEWGGSLLYTLGLIGAVFTAFYMSRLFFGIFFGDFKGWKIVKKWKDPGHGHDDHHHEHHSPGKALEGPVPHESPWQMWLPLAILGFLAAFAGFLNAHPLGLHVFDHWLEPVFQTARKAIAVKEHSQAPFLAAAVVAFAAGVGGAYWVFVLQKGEPARAFVEKFPGFHALVKDKWRIDELYDETFIGAVDALAEVSVWFDKWIVDGVIARLSAFVVTIFGTVLRYAQTGRVQAYAFVMVLGLGWLGWFFFAPHAEARITNDHAKGAYSVAATPGPGYSYRWDADGDGKWDSDGYGSKREVNFELKVDQKRNVRFEVRNAFGRTAESEISFTRPPQDLSGASAEELKAAEPAGARPSPRRPPSAPEIPVGQ